ncbi:MAG: cyclase family protein [Planctomycetaceae bacterium]|nr:cyclase family protein [Planctomycetaceae bacterium]
MLKNVRWMYGPLIILAAGFLWRSEQLRADDAGQRVQPVAAERTDNKTTPAPVRGWKKGQGWGWIWGPDDEIGALNAMTEESRLAALSLVTKGKTYDLGATYSRNSYKWPGHSPGEVMTFRTPEGVKRQGDHDFIAPEVNPSGQAWHSCALFINDNVATQIDGLGHVTVGEDNHWYNGFKESDWGGNFGIRKCAADGIPPIINRAVLLDIAALRKVKVLPAHYPISPDDVDSACAAQGVEIRPGDIVLFRTGTLGFWGKDGADHATIAEYDSAGITLDTARYLVEEKGAIALGSDTSGLEVAPAPPGSDTFIPVHKYLLIEQGVHILEFHNLEELARDRVYEFCYMAATNKIAGTVAGFALRPIALK